MASYFEYRVRCNASDLGTTAKKLNPILREITGNIKDRITNYPELRKQIGDEFAWLASDYVPLDTGRLADSGTGTKDGRVVWYAVDPEPGDEYAREQYTNLEFKHEEPRTAYWDRMVNRDAFYENVRDVIMEYFGK